MLFLNSPAPLLVLVGPTAVGKTELSLELAERLNGEIISADSRLFYRGMDIGTAKPTLAERQRVPHHLIDVTDPADNWTLTIFQAAAAQAIAEVQARGRLPLLVGGTGQYVWAVIQGWAPPEQDPDPALRDILERWGRQIGPEELHRRLRRIDPAAAARIESRNLRRTVRALEVIFTTGQRFSAQQRRTGSPYTTRIIGLQRPRPELYARIDARIDAVLAAGLVQEVQALLEGGCPPNAPALSAIGYREIGQYLQGKITLPEAIVEMKRLTRQFVRRQGNWFKTDDPQIAWFDAASITAAELETQTRSWTV